jgi:AraC-like DNA-binding protein
LGVGVVRLVEYTNQHRVSHARRLLVTTNEKILTIALESGFRSLSRFNVVVIPEDGVIAVCSWRAHGLR